MENEKSIINKIEDRHEETFRGKYVIGAIVPQQSQPDEKSGQVSRWLEVLIIKGSKTFHANAGIDSGIDKIPLYREYDLSFEYNEEFSNNRKKTKIRIVGVWGINNNSPAKANN